MVLLAFYDTLGQKMAPFKKILQIIALNKKAESLQGCFLNMPLSNIMIWGGSYINNFSKQNDSHSIEDDYSLNGFPLVGVKILILLNLLIHLRKKTYKYV